MDDILLKYFKKKCLGKNFSIADGNYPNLKSKEEIDKWICEMEDEVRNAFVLISEMESKKESIPMFNKERKQQGEFKIIKPHFNND